MADKNISAIGLEEAINIVDKTIEKYKPNSNISSFFANAEQSDSLLYHQLNLISRALKNNLVSQHVLEGLFERNIPCHVKKNYGIFSGIYGGTEFYFDRQNPEQLSHRSCWFESPKMPFNLEDLNHEIPECEFKMPSNISLIFDA